MDLQSVFYVVSIIFMLTVIFIAVSAVIAVFFIRRKISQITRMATKPAETVIEGIGTKVKEAFFSKRK